MPSCRPMNAQNLEGSWTMSFTKKRGSRRLTKEIHSIGLDWVALTWGTQLDMCAGASSSTGLPPLRASVFESLHQNEAVAWQRRKRKATPTAPAASKRQYLNGTSKHFVSISSFCIHSQQFPTVAWARFHYMRRPSRRNLVGRIRSYETVIDGTTSNSTLSEIPTDSCHLLEQVSTPARTAH